jgi:glycosyltransferase involved in cell wall biosynthesis
MGKPLTIAWISDFPVEWLPDVPEGVRHLPRRHPATWQMVLLAEFEKRADLKLHIILFRQRIEKSFSFERNGVFFHVLKASPPMRLATVFMLDTFLIRRLCRRIKPDLVHAWGIEKGAGLIAHRLGYPCLMTVQGLYGWYKELFPLAPYDRFVERLERRTFRRARVVTTESNFAVAYLKQHYPRLQVQQAEHAPNQVFFNARRRPGLKPFHFIFVGVVSFRKGTDLLFQALDQLAGELPWKLTIISGPKPPYLDQLRATVSPSFWEKVEHKHDLLPHEVARELETAAMLLLPTRADTSPNAVKEAAVAGVPVVASTIGGIPDYIFPGKNGFLFEPNNLPAFIASIRAACAHPLFGQGLVDSGTLAQVRDYLSPKRMAQNFLTAYEAVRSENIQLREQ